MEPNIALVGSLIGDLTRSKMLVALMSGKALTATELSLVADITPQTASSHLDKLVRGYLLVVRKQGRHKYFQLKNEQVADLVEQMLNISSALSDTDLFTGPEDPELRKARVCYDHLAGEVGVALFNALRQRGLLVADYTEAQLTEDGYQFFSDLGVDFNALKTGRRPLCKACLDWSERKSHLAGSLGKWMLNDVINRKWAKQDLNNRALHFSAAGLKAFSRTYGI